MAFPSVHPCEPPSAMGKRSSPSEPESALLLRSSGTKQTLVKQRHKCSHVTSVLCLSKEKYLSLSLTLEALYMESFRLQASFQDFQFLVLHGFSTSYSAFPIEGVNPLLLTPKAPPHVHFFPQILETGNFIKAFWPGEKKYNQYLPVQFCQHCINACLENTFIISRTSWTEITSYSPAD